MKRILLPLALLSLLIPFTTPDRIAAASSPTDGARQSMPVERSQIQTRLEAPSVVNVPVGTPARITVRVTASGGRIPKGRVVLWDVDIPNAATFASHTITLDKRGTATFVVREELPGVPFDVKDVTVYYVPKSGSRFAAATSNAFELGMYLWPSSLAMSLGRNDGNGQAVPLDLSLKPHGWLRALRRCHDHRRRSKRHVSNPHQQRLSLSGHGTGRGTRRSARRPKHRQRRLCRGRLLRRHQHARYDGEYHRGWSSGRLLPIRVG